MSQSTTVKAETTTSKYRFYKNVEADLRRRVSVGEWGPGTLLPRRRDLAREYEIDVNTLQRAILPLVADGTLLAEGKRGTFVNGGAHAAPPPPPAGSSVGESGRQRRNEGDTLRGVGLKNKTVGVIAQLVTGRPLYSDTGATHTRDTIRSIEAACSAAGGQARVFNTYLAGGTGCCVTEAISILLKESVDAIVVVDIYDNPAISLELSSMPVSEDFPLVYVSSVGDFVPYLHVFYDQRHAGYLAASHLIERGWTDVNFIAPYRANWVEDRIAGARLAVERSGVPNCRFSIVPASRMSAQFETNEQELCIETVRTAIIKKQLLGGIIAPNDNLARAVSSEMSRVGMMPGVDFALAGFDDDIESSSDGLTSVRPPLEEMGALAVRLVSRRMAGEPVNLHICLRSQLVARSSTAARE